MKFINKHSVTIELMLQKGFGKILLIFILLVGIPIGILGFQVIKSNTNIDVKEISGKNSPFNQRYSRGKCLGEGTTTFSYSPTENRRYREYRALWNYG